MDAERRMKIAAIFERFLKARAKTVSGLELRDLDINPFLIRLLSKEVGLSSGDAIIEWVFNQHFERGTVTSFGTTLQKVAQVFSEGTGVEGADILKRKNGRRYHIQVKSGPNAVPKELAKKISELLQSAQRRNRGSVALYGMCYGHPERVSAIVRNPNYMTVGWIVGKEFWEFISDDPQCSHEIYEIAADVSENFRPLRGKRLREIIEEKLVKLKAEFRSFYGETSDALWRKLLENNS